MVRLALAGSLLSAGFWIPSAHGQTPGWSALPPAPETPRRYDIPAGSLSAVLARFSSESGVLLAGAAGLVQGRKSPGLQGVYSVPAAFDAILAGSGLQAVWRKEGEYALQLVVAENGERTMATVAVTAKADRDQEKRDGVYLDNVTNLYQGRKELERNQVHNAADVFKSMTGVYSMDPRNGNALAPNIRGISGQGRVPVTVDGTEQSTDIWLGTMFGVNNKSYVDPALFRSIAVEKGPSLSRGVRSGVGGAVSIRTIDPADIIPEGRSFGIESKIETSGNTIGQRTDPRSYYGRDYRDLPNAVVGTSGNVTITPTTPLRQRGSKDLLNLQDRSFMLTLAGRNDMTDALLSYSERSKGNYFAGKRGADAYRNNDAYAKGTEAYFPNTAKLYEPGAEVANTSSETSTLLLKNNWYLPDRHKLGLSFMRTRLEFGENNNSQALMAYGLNETGAIKAGSIADTPESRINMDTWRFTYDYKPGDNPWVDFQSSLWMTQVDGKREQTGGANYFVLNRDTVFDDWQSCKRNGKPVSGSFLLCLLNPVLKSPTPPAKQPNTDGRYNIVAASTQWTDHNRIGADFSNKVRISDRFSLTFGGEIQREKLQENVLNLYKDAGSGLGPDGATLAATTQIFGPRSGRREEWAGSVNAEWTPVPWLTVSAGTRYSEFWAFDDGLAERRRKQAAGSEITQERTGVKLQYAALMTNAELQQVNSLAKAMVDAVGTYGAGSPEYAAALAAYQNNMAQHGDGTGYRMINGAAYWVQVPVVVPVVNGKVDSSQSPFANGTLDLSKTVTNPQTAGVYVLGANTTEPSVPGTYATYVPLETSSRGTQVYSTPSASSKWAQPEERKGHAWSPVMAVTLRATDYISLFTRYAQITRFPSIFEIASTSVGTTTPFQAQGVSKPERSTNWEIGYAHDLTQFFPRLRQADVRLSWFETNIKDFIERDLYLNVIQYERKESAGVEFQSRFDSGGFYGSLGATWRKRQKLCDKDYAYSMDVYYNRVPECMTGGFADTVTASSLQPKYSVNAELGFRAFENRLESGIRALYHAKAENRQLDELLGGPLASIWSGKSAPQYYWHSVLLYDLYAQFRVDKTLALNAGVTNLTDRYYLDPMAKIPVPGPGRTLSVGLRLSF